MRYGRDVDDGRQYKTHPPSEWDMARGQWTVEL
jgi:hypothetical protein